MKILLTGASGFVGSAIAERLAADQHDTIAAMRQKCSELPASIQQQNIAGLSSHQDWSPLVQDAEVVVHCAARVHVMKETSNDPLAEFRKTNVEGTLNLARQAAAAGAKRFIFVSSIKVNGESTPQGRPFTAHDTPAPSDAYGISKLEAELALRDLSRSSGLEVVIIRPVLIYGSGVKANFRLLVKLVETGLPLPLGAIDNRRSLVALDNLVDLIMACLAHPAAKNQTFLVSDGDDLSTTDLIKQIAKALGKPPRLLPIPSGFVKFAAFACGKTGLASRLLGSLQVDINHTRDLLDWIPPTTIHDALKRSIEKK